MNLFEDRLPGNLCNDKNQLIPEPDFINEDSLQAQLIFWPLAIKVSPRNVNSGHLGIFNSKNLIIYNSSYDPNFPQQLNVVMPHGLVYCFPFVEIRTASICGHLASLPFHLRLTLCPRCVVIQILSPHCTF